MAEVLSKEQMRSIPYPLAALTAGLAVHAAALTDDDISRIAQTQFCRPQALRDLRDAAQKDQ